MLEFNNLMKEKTPARHYSVKSEFSLGVTQSIPCLQNESQQFAQCLQLRWHFREAGQLHRGGGGKTAGG